MLSQQSSVCHRTKGAVSASKRAIAHTEDRTAHRLLEVEALPASASPITLLAVTPQAHNTSHKKATNSKRIPPRTGSTGLLQKRRRGRTNVRSSDYERAGCSCDLKCARFKLDAARKEERTSVRARNTVQGPSVLDAQPSDG